MKADQLPRMIRSWLRRLAGKRTVQERWDARWASYDAAGITEMTREVAHYSVLAGYALELRPNGALLDVGCGDGILRARLHPDAFSSYLGIDFAEAIARAEVRADNRTSFAVADMSTFVPTRRFDSIVFNESLYYAADPLAELRRYSAFLGGDGVFLVSMHRKERSEKVWADIGERFTILDRVLVSKREGAEWIVGAFRPRSPTS